MFLLNRQFQPLIEVPPDQKNIVYYACIVLYLLSIVFSVLVNMSLLVAVLRSKKNYIQRPFYILLIQVIIANLLSVISNLYCSVPVVTFLPYPAVKEFILTTIYQIFGIFDSMSDQLIQLLVLAIAVHRFFTLVVPAIPNIFFKKIAFRVLLAAIWLLAILIAIAFSLSQCSFKYPVDEKIESSEDVQKYKDTPTKYQFSCNVSGSAKPLNEDISAGNVFLAFYIGQKALFPFIILLCYIAVVVKLFLIRRTPHADYGEIEILKQGLIVFLLFQISPIITAVVYTTPLQINVVFLVRRWIATAELLAGALSPLFIILTNKDIRRAIFFCNRTKVIPLSLGRAHLSPAPALSVTPRTVTNHTA